MVKKVLYGITVLLFAILLYHVFDLYSYTKERDSIVQETGLRTMGVLKDEVDKLLSEIVHEAERLAEDFGKNEYSKTEIEKIIKESSLKLPALQGVTACFEPYAQSADQRLYCPFYNKGQGRYIFVGENYDYTDRAIDGTAWYTGIIDDGAKWVDPYYGASAKEWFIDYALPFYYTSGPKKGQIRGVITMSFETRRFKKLILSLSLGKTGFGMLTSEEGNFLSHPINSYIGTTNLKEIMAEETIEPLIKAYKDILSGNSGSVVFEQQDNEGEALFFYDKIPSSGWGIAFMFYKNELLLDKAKLHHRYIKLALLLSALIFIIIAIYFNKDYLDNAEIWQLSMLASVLLIINTFFIWNLEYASNRDMDEESPPVSDMGNLDNFIDQRNIRFDALKAARPIPVPTGIYINRIAFVNSYNLNVSGTIWQKYPMGTVEKVTIGFRLPQTSPFAEASFIEENHRTIIQGDNNGEGSLLVAYDFRVTLQQYLDYQNFPFDKRHIRIDIVPINIEDGLLFTPDLASYEFTGPSKKPGLDQLVRIPGNRIMKSYFNYTVESYDADFGLESEILFEDVPVLHYNINLRRILLNVFVTYLIPIFVVLIMMFILIIACSKTEERQGIIEAMAAFFFVLIFSHIDMRREIITADLIFMEYFYFITYFMIILSTWNLITYAKSKAPLFDYEENLIFKTSFFPFFFLCILIITLGKFY